MVEGSDSLLIRNQARASCKSYLSLQCKFTQIQCGIFFDRMIRNIYFDSRPQLSDIIIMRYVLYIFVYSA